MSWWTAAAIAVGAINGGIVIYALTGVAIDTVNQRRHSTRARPCARVYDWAQDDDVIIDLFFNEIDVVSDATVAALASARNAWNRGSDLLPTLFSDRDELRAHTALYWEGNPNVIPLPVRGNGHGLGPRGAA